MKLYIKYMVSLRCKMVVKDVLARLGIPHLTIELGMVELQENILPCDREKLRTLLLSYGLELLDDKKSILVEKIKCAVTEMIHYADEEPVDNYSDYLSNKLNYNYTYPFQCFFGSKRDHLAAIHHQAQDRKGEGTPALWRTELIRNILSPALQ